MQWLTIFVFNRTLYSKNELKNLTIKNASNFVETPFVCQKNISNLTISEIKGIEAETELFDVLSVEVKATVNLELYTYLKPKILMFFLL